MENKKGFLDRIPTFSAVLILLVLMIVGGAMIPLLKIGYMPSEQESDKINISMSWSGASPAAMEQEITAKVEGIVSSINGVQQTMSNSGVGNGHIYAELKKGANNTAVRFELASRIRHLSESLPEGANVYVSEDRGGEESSSTMVLSYNINAEFDRKKIKEYVETNITPFITQIDYVKDVSVSGSSPLFLEITYDPYRLKASGIDPNIISSGLEPYLGKSDIIGDIDRIGGDGKRERVSLLLRTEELKRDITKVPLGNVDGKMIYLSDIATVDFKESSSKYFYRVNGENVVAMNINIDSEQNLINASAELREKIEEIKSRLSDDFTITLDHDEAKEVRDEISKLVRRTSLSLVILFLFVLLVSRSMRYLSIIAISLIANVLIAFIFFYIFDIELNLISLAGISVSFGIVIDTTIVMVDHYSYYRNRSVFIAILAALLTTIGSLVIVYGLPDFMRSSLEDFSAIIIINLSVALFISLIFVPALIERFGLKMSDMRRSANYYRRIGSWSSFYTRYINFTQNKKWLYAILIVLMFGLPVDMLPAQLGSDPMARYRAMQQGKEYVAPELNWYQKTYNSIASNETFKKYFREPLAVMFGGTMRIFAKNINSRSYHMRSGDRRFSIQGEALEGTDTDQLNQKTWELDRFLQQFDEIKSFTTNVSENGAYISAELKDEFKEGDFLKTLENLAREKAESISGVKWNVSSSDNMYGGGMRISSFSGGGNQKAHSIGVTGYNYSKLLSFSEEVAEMISTYDSVKNVAIGENSFRMHGGGSRGGGELFINYDMEKVALYGLNLSQGYNAISELMKSGSVGRYQDSNGEGYNISYVSTKDKDIGVWDLMNSYYDFGGTPMKYSLIGDIEMRSRSGGNSIRRQNQEYNMSVSFDYEGATERADSIINEITDKVNSMLPIGFRVGNTSMGWYHDSGEQYLLLFAIIFIIFFVCAVLFESLRQPFIIIMMIPISFVGTFLAFPIFRVEFGVGGFASLILLSGLVVNAAIYVINEYNHLNRRQLLHQGVDSLMITPKRNNSIKKYVKAFNHKWIAVMLTIVSTILGLIPFLLDGSKGDDFWFTFAVGTIGGLIFSAFALVFIMPIFIPFKAGKKRSA